MKAANSAKGWLGLTVAAVATALAAGCGSDSTGSDDEGTAGALPTGGEPVKLEPAEFTTRVDNPYFPLAPGSRWVYRESSEGSPQRDVVTVTRRTRLIAGIRARVVRDLVTADGTPVEDTYDWFAQDAAGNVWYLGEDTREYRNGKVVSTKGSWEAGVDGAEAGIAMPAGPRPGLSYRQEYSAGVAEDRGRVLSVDAKVRVPFGSYRNAVRTRDDSPLEPNLVEHKLYARGIGAVAAITVSGGSERQVLVDYRRGG